MLRFFLIILLIIILLRIVKFFRVLTAPDLRSDTKRYIERYIEKETYKRDQEEFNKNNHSK